MPIEDFARKYRLFFNKHNVSYLKKNIKNYYLPAIVDRYERKPGTVAQASKKLA